MHDGAAVVAELMKANGGGGAWAVVTQDEHTGRTPLMVAALHGQDTPTDELSPTRRTSMTARNSARPSARPPAARHAPGARAPN